MHSPAPLATLFGRDEFVGRHVGPDERDVASMLSTVGVASVDDLIDRTVPASIRLTTALPLPGPRSPEDVLAELRGLAARNTRRHSLIGMGYYNTVCPPVVRRNVLENPAWYTAYTPYQPEISQGRLEALLNFQTMVANLTGFELANSSLLDEATAAAEAMTMCRRLSKSGSNRFVIHHDTHPQTINVIRTRSTPIGIEVHVGDVDDIADGCFGVLLSLPTSTGDVPDWRAAIDRAHQAGALVVVATDLLALTLVLPPGDLPAGVPVVNGRAFVSGPVPIVNFLADRYGSARSH